jgi:PAS domain S-box-containing protein
MLKLKSLAQDCVIATAIVFTALLLMLGLDPWLGMTQTPFLLFFGAVPIAALYLGRRGGIVATVLAALLANYFFIFPKYSFSLDLVGSSRALIFLFEGTLISILIGALRRAQQQTKESLHQLEASEAKFRRLVDSNIIGVVSCDIYGAITEANDALLNSLGYTREDLLAGRIRWDEMTPADMKHLDIPAYEELITKGRNTPYEKAFIGKQGQRVPVVVGAALLEDDPEQVISFILDVSDRKRAEQRLAVQYAVARALAEAATVSDAIPRVLQSLCESLGWQLGFFWQIDLQTNTLRYFNSWHPPDLDVIGMIRAKEKTTFAPGVGLPGRIWESGQPAWIVNLAQDANFPRKALANEAGLQSVLGFPVSLNQEILGVIECFSDRYQEPDDDLLKTVVAIGSQIGQFIERKQTEEELQASQALFQSFMNYCPINAYIKEESGRYLYVNPRVEHSFNRPLVDWLGKTDFDFFASEVAQPIRENDLAVLQAGQITQLVETSPLDDGDHHYLSFKFPIKDATGRLLLAGMSLDISDRKRFEVEREQLLQQLEFSLGQLEAVINSMTEGLLIADAQGNILRFNPAALALHGYESLEQVQQHQFQTTFEAHDLQGNLIPIKEWALAKALSGETFSNWEIQVKRLDTGKTWIGSYSGTPVRNKQGEISLAIVTTHDVTQQRQAQVELARSLAAEKTARAEAEAANQIKDEFLAVLSHELRTPLNPILGWVRLLRNGNLDPQKTAHAVETIERNTKLQIQLIEDLLDISRILQGKLTLNVSPINLATVIEAAKETVRLAAEAKSINLQFTIVGSDLEDEQHSAFLLHGQPNKNPIQVMGDFNRLQQVVWNLLSNAVKFTPAGGRVEVRLERGLGSVQGVGELGEAFSSTASNPCISPTYAQITVTDTGKGISPSFLPHIFEYFRQADSSITRKFGGLGLGLAIARQIVELHGGTIQAQSAGEGQGATFVVRLPLLKAEGRGQKAESDSSLLSHSSSLMFHPLSGVRVLAVDDEADNLELVRFVLEQAGAIVTLSTSAGEALQHMAQCKPDVLVTDISMPEMDGYTLIRKIRALPYGQQIPAIALTAYAGEFNQQQALAAGFQQHISKPVEPDALIKAISRLLK